MPRCAALGMSLCVMMTACLSDPPDRELGAQQAALQPAPSIQLGAPEPLGRFAGVDYTRHPCRFGGTTHSWIDPQTLAGHTFDVYCSVILPTDLRHWNHLLVFEVLHPAGAQNGSYRFGEPHLNNWLRDTRDRPGGALFERRFGYVSLSWQKTAAGATYRALGDRIDGPTGVGVEIMVAFVDAVRGGATGLFEADDVEHVIALGGSATGVAVRSLLVATAAVERTHVLPAVALGTHRFSAVPLVPGPIPIVLCGGSVDLTCSQDFLDAVSDHGGYVSTVADLASKLVAERLLLRDDAVRLIQEAAASGVARPGTCP